ncbi:MAG: hypothetical protein Q8873_01675 [Bacillota bacterium]|nr:hypothetical protein [Bacillota bacterium]
MEGNDINFTQETIEEYRHIRDEFYIPGLSCITDVMLFNNGLKYVYIEDTLNVRAGYGIRVRYIDKQGRRRMVTGYGTTIFLGIETPVECNDVVIGLDSDPDVSMCRNFVQIRAKITLQYTVETVK